MKKPKKKNKKKTKKQQPRSQLAKTVMVVANSLLLLKVDVKRDLTALGKTATINVNCARLKERIHG